MEAYGLRDATGLAMAWLEEDDELAGEIVELYGLRGEALDLVFGTLALLKEARSDDDELCDRLYERALSLAAR